VTSNRKRWMLTLCLLLVVCLAGVAYVVTFQKHALRNMVQGLIAGSLGAPVTFQHIRVEIFPRPRLTLTGVSIGDPERDNPIFQASDIRLGISVFSLAQDALEPNVVTIENAHLDLERDEHGQWNYHDLLHGGASNGLGVLLSGFALELVNGSLEIEDRFSREVPLHFRADEIELQVERFALKGSTDVFLSARLSDQGTGSLLSSYGTIEHVGGFLGVIPTEPGDLPPQLALHTRVEFDRHTLVQATNFFRFGAVPADFQGHTTAHGHVRIAPGVRGYDLVLSDLVVLTDVVDLNVDLIMAGLFHSEPPTISSQWTSTPLAIRHLSHVLPSDWLASDLYQNIRRQVLHGKIQAVSATVSGSAREGWGYSLGGEFHLSEGTVAFGSEWGQAEQVSGVIHVRPDRIRLSGFQGLYGHIPVTEATGIILLNEDGPWLTTELVGVVSPTQLTDVVQKIFDWETERYAMPFVQGQAGQGIMTLRFGGPLQDPARIMFQDAQYRPEQVTLQLPGSQGLVTHLNGVLAFSPNYLRFENVRGQYGTSDFHIEGQMDFAKPSSLGEVSIQGRLHSDDLATLFPESSLAEQEVLSGTADYLVVVTGKPEIPVIRGTVDLQGLGIVVPGIINKALPLEGQFAWNVQLGKNRQLAFHHVSLTFPSVSLTGQGHVRYGQTPALNVSLTSAPIHLTDLPPGLRLFDGVIPAGTLEVALALQGTGHDWRSWSKSGWVALTQGTINLDGMTPPVSHVFLRARLNGHAVDLKQLQWRMGESLARATGVIQQWDSQPAMTFTLTSSQFDLARLIPSGPRSILRKTLEDIARTATISGDLQFDRAWYNELSFRALTGRLRIQNSVISLEAVQGQTTQGTIRGQMVTHLPAERPATVKTRFAVHKIPLLALEQTFLEEKTLDERLLTGMVSVEGMLAGHGNDARGILPTLTGRLKIAIADGRIKRGTVIPKILALLNVPSMLQGQVDLLEEGYPFDKQTGTLTVDNGRLVSEDIVMDGPILKMTAAGQYDFMHDELNVVAASSPLGSYFDLLRKISLFGMLIDDDQEVLSALFEIKGSLSDPQVTYMPLESLAFGVTQFGELAFNVLKNTITLPKKMFFHEEPTVLPEVQSADSGHEDEEF